MSIVESALSVNAWRLESLPVYALNLTIPPLAAALLLATLSLALIWSIASRRRKKTKNAPEPDEPALPPPSWSFLDDLPLPVCAFDAQGLLIFWNRECERLSGLSAAETIANLQICARLFPDQQHPRSWTAPTTELTLTGRDGQAHLIRWHRLASPQAAWPIWLCGQDATAQAALRQDLDRCHAVLRDIFNDLGLELYVLDPQYKVVISNKAAAENQPCYKAVCGKPELSPDCPAREVFATGLNRRDRREHAGRFKDASLIPIFDSEHNVKHVVEIVEDSTEKQLAERERRLLERHQRQDQKLEALATLAGGMAHDFNNILASICGYAEILSYEQSEPDRVNQYATQITQAAQEAKSLVRQVLMFSRKNQAEPRAVSVVPLIRETIAGLRPSLAPGVELELTISTENAQIWADPYQVHELVKSLCENAIQSTNSGTISVELTSSASQGELPAGDGLRLRVADTGAGMDPATLARIFDPFFTTRAMGRGLGLAMAHSIVQNLGGEITVKSQPGLGSCFTVYLPIVVAAPPRATVDDENLPCGQGQNILVIDSQTEILDQACAELKRLGYNVTALSESATAFKLLESHPERFAAVLADVGQPQDCGQWLVRRISAINPQLPVMLASSYADSLDPFLLKNLGVNHVVHKPLAADELAASLKSLLSR